MKNLSILKSNNQNNKIDEKNIINNIDEIEFFNIIKDMLNDDTVVKMKEYRHHYDSSCYDHCLEVSYMSYKYCKKHHLDYIAASRAGMVHDLFLYDWRHSGKELNLPGLHAFVHPQIAYDNAAKLFDLNDKEKDIIIKHMWPVTITKFPKYKESFVITVADKVSALNSSAKYYKEKSKNNILYKFAYIFLSLILVKTFKVKL